MRAAWYIGLYIWAISAFVATLSAGWLWWQSAKREQMFVKADLSLAETVRYLMRVALSRMFAALAILIVPIIALFMYNVPPDAKFGDPLRVTMPVGVGVLLIYLLIIPSSVLFVLVLSDLRRLFKIRP